MKRPALLLGTTLLAATFAAADLPTPDAMTAALTAARDEAEWPGLTVADAARNLATPEEAIRFVRDGIANASYPGVFQGAEGTLRTRSANPTDKALLLAKLLQAMGWEAGVVSGPMPADANLHPTPGLDRERPALEALRGLAAPHGQPARTRFLRPADQARAELDSMDREVDAAYAVLAKSLQDLDWKPTGTGTPVTKPNAAWVGARKPGGDWGLYSPVVAGNQTPPEFTAVEPTAGTLSLSVDMVGASGRAISLLQWSGSTSTVSGMDLHLGWMPRDERAKNLVELQVPMTIEINEWRPVLQVGELEVKGNPFTIGTDAPLLRLALNLEHNGKTTSITRVLHDLGPGFDRHELIATHRLGIAAAGIPAATVEARILDELRDMSQLNQFAAGGARDASTSNKRGLSTRSAEIINAMIATAAHLDPAAEHLGWQGPAILLETTKLKKRGSEVVSVTLLDMLNQAFGPAADAPTELKMKWGLAVCATEARLVQGTSVNRLLLDADGGLVRVKATGLLAGADLALGNPTVPNAALALANDGTLRGIITERALVQAKGGMGAERTAVAGGAYAALGSAALTAGGASPLGPLVGGIAGYLNELAKAYRGAAAKLDWLARTIEAGHEVEDTSNADEQLRNLARNLLGGMARGYATSYVTSGLSAVASGGLTAAGHTVTPAMDGAIDLGFGTAGAAASLDEDTIRGALRAGTTAR